MAAEEAERPEKVENAVADSSDGDKAGKGSIDQTQGTIGALVNDVKTDNNTDGTNETTIGKSPSENTNGKDLGREDRSVKENRPSKRVQEGRKYNERPRNYYNKPDRSVYQKNIKSDLTSQKESSDPAAIRKQVEFYFSDSNLLQDKFLFTKVEGHENLPVPISVIHSFKRMRHFQPVSAIVEALKESSTLNVVEGNTCIQRKAPLPEGLVGKPMVEIQKVHEDQAMARSIYAKGFGDEGPSTQFDIEAFFANHGATNSVRLRRSYEQSFKGSVFVEFDSEATQKSFLDLDPKPKWHGEELQVKSKKQYCDEKVDDIKVGKVRANESDDRRVYQYKSNHKRRRDSTDNHTDGKEDEKDGRDWRVRRENDRKSGFKDRNGGKHRGFGSSGRGRGSRDDRGHRDRNHDRNDRDERGVPKIRNATPDSNEIHHKDKFEPGAALINAKEDDQAAPTISNDVSKSGGDKAMDTSNELPHTVAAAAKESSPAEPSSKKRAREEDDATAVEQPAKKLDTKSGEP